ncbi:hypothetical protein [Flammeovirga pacifica]|uniref:ATP-grasp domain-containing protein n=1 Tax=Flammeovirga pacifica TaxID=915059 RepID=A0A1S1YWC6_FLAPC|nr:hypothetical protein [Flammeovirga pacifica]OHX65321.1 hypothetical protein NH26_02630 [Flammeovirga pacifica]
MPKYFLFNPYCELSVAKNARNYTPNKQFKVLSNDLSTLPVWLFGDKVFIINEYGVKNRWSNQLKKLFNKDVSFLSLKQLQNKVIEKKSFLVWGNSIDFVEYFSKKPYEIRGINEWTLSDRALYHREIGYKILDYIINLKREFYISKSLKGSFYSSEIEVLEAFEKTFDKFSNGVVFKLPFSASGRGLLLLKKKEMNQAIESWIESGISVHNSILVEPWLDKLMDFSLLYDFNEKGIEFLGVTVFDASSTGQYGGSLLGDYKKIMPEEISDVISVLANDLMQAFKRTNEYNYHKGKLGVDAMIIRSDDGTLKVHPCVEVNARHTMGHITLGLRKAVHDPNRSRWVITTKNQIEDFHQFEKEMSEKYPCKMKNYKLESGFFPLVDVNLVSQYYAYLIADKE